MKFVKTTSLSALILMIVLTIPMIMQIAPTVKAASTVNVKTYLFVNAAPSPVGVGQTIFVVYSSINLYL